MLFGRARHYGLGTLHPLLDDAQMHAGAIRQVFARSANHFFEDGLSLSVLLLVEILHSLFERLQLLFHRWIDRGAGRLFG